MKTTCAAMLMGMGAWMVAGALVAAQEAAPAVAGAERKVSLAAGEAASGAAAAAEPVLPPVQAGEQSGQGAEFLAAVPSWNAVPASLAARATDSSAVSAPEAEDAHASAKKNLLWQAGTEISAPVSEKVSVIFTAGSVRRQDHAEQLAGQSEGVGQKGFMIGVGIGVSF